MQLQVPGRNQTCDPVTHQLLLNRVRCQQNLDIFIVGFMFIAFYV
jgi:hypothetical protein